MLDKLLVGAEPNTDKWLDGASFNDRASEVISEASSGSVEFIVVKVDDCWFLKEEIEAFEIRRDIT